MNIAQRNFAGGELAPAMYARTDHVKYATGLRTCRNFMVLRHGGVANRPGTLYIGETKDSEAVRLVRWAFNSEQTYLLEFGDEYLRFYRDDGLILDGAGPAVYEVVTPYTAAQLDDLQFVQSADVMTIVHPSHVVYELIRNDHDDWDFAAKVFGPSISAPTNVNNEPGILGPGRTLVYTVTAISATGEESLGAAADEDSLHMPDDSNPDILTWDAVAGAVSYNVYCGIDGQTPGYIGNNVSATFSNPGIQPDYTYQAPQDRDLFDGAGEYPAVVSYYQQRQIFAASVLAPETVWASRSANYDNFLTSTPLQDDDAITFSLVGRRVNRIRHILDLGQLIMLTEAGEWKIEGDSAGIVRPTEINPRQFTHNGASRLAPVIINDTAIYVQSRGTIVRDLAGNVQTQGFVGSDLTLFSTHLFDGHTIVDMDYQQIPHSIIWIVRSDGVLLGLTYIKEQEIWGWHRHDTEGTVERVCVLPDGEEDAVYIVVLRGEDRFIERLATREGITTAADGHFVDCGLSYDGRDYGRRIVDLYITMVLSGGSTWLAGETLTLTASQASFVAGDVGNAIFLHASDGSIVACTITAYSSSTVVSVTAAATVPVVARGATIDEWDRAIDELTGLDHLDGYAVSVVTDGGVVANPNNPAYATITVSGGSITLDNPASVVRVGLPYISDLMTLDLDTAQGPSVKGKRLDVSNPGLMVESTLGLYIGAKPPSDDDDDPLEDLTAPQRDGESLFASEDTEPFTGLLTATIQRGWDGHGRLFVRQLDPLPASILSVVSTGYSPQG